MKIDLYHLYRVFDYAKFVNPFILRVLRAWSEPLGHEVRTQVCREGDVDLATDADVVGFTVYTQTAPAVFRLCQKLRARGKVVVLGGPHFRGSDCREADGNCDVVAESISEEQWKELLRKIEDGRIAPNRPHPLVIKDASGVFRYPDDCREAPGSRKWYQLLSVPTSFGCAHRCAFCNPYMPGRYFPRNVDAVCREIAGASRRTVILCDAAFGLNREHTIDLMRATSRLGKRMLVETTLSRLADKQLVKAMAQGGVRFISVGIESLERHFSKHGDAGTEEGLKRAVGNAHEVGILVQGSYICGFDSDGPEVFERVFNQYMATELDLIAVSVLTPHPNTALHRRLANEGRIFDTNWEHYDDRHVVFEPKNMSADELIDGFIELHGEIMSVSCALKKAQQAFDVLGFCGSSALVATYHVLSKVLFRKRRKAFRRGRALSEVRSGEKRPGEARTEGERGAAALSVGTASSTSDDTH